jgi:hypothetical protein
MVMIVKDHEKQAHGFISVTWPAPGNPPTCGPSSYGLRAVVLRRDRRTGRPQLTAMDGGPWPLPCPWALNARTFALGLHPSEQ